jgi:ribose 1,5-bisphosphokinase
VLVVGPSGAGKDTLLTGARSRLAGLPRYRFVRRTITRRAGPSEDNEHLSEAQFTRAEAEGRFIVTWSAHGLRYGVPASARDSVANGDIVICNGSRHAVEVILERFSSVRLVHVTAPRDVRLRRLIERGRDLDIESRLDRLATDDVSWRADLVIDNSGTIEDGVEALVTFLQSLP